MSALSNVRALTFDLFGTVLDLQGSLTPSISEFLTENDADVDADAFWSQWRARQRIEQYQDTILSLGHSGYLKTAERALVYTLQLNGLAVNSEDIERLMNAWQNLSPFPEVEKALQRLAKSYRRVVLSNGDRDFLQHLCRNRIKHRFSEVISVDRVSAFKPYPAVYRRAARELNLEPHECLMVSANSFDVLGARSCGYRAAFVNRLNLPYEDSPYKPDVTVADFTELAEVLLVAGT